VSDDRRRRGPFPARGELSPAVAFWVALVVVLVVLFVLGGRHVL
jgi:hypothetical protein